MMKKFLLAALLLASAPVCAQVVAPDISSTRIAISNSATGSTAAVVATLPAVQGRFTYICGFDVSAIGGTAVVGPVTVAGLVGGSMTYQVSSATAGNTFSRTFTPCIPASAVNTTITITTTADGTATAVDVNSWGYQWANQ